MRADHQLTCWKAYADEMLSNVEIGAEGCNAGRAARCKINKQPTRPALIVGLHAGDLSDPVAVPVIDRESVEAGNLHCGHAHRTFGLAQRHTTRQKHRRPNAAGPDDVRAREVPGDFHHDFQTCVWNGGSAAGFLSMRIWL